MESSPSQETPFWAFEDEAIGRRLIEALYEVAAEQGGEEFAESVAEAAAPDHETGSVMPDPKGIAILHERFPGAIAVVISRLQEKGEAERQRGN